MSIVGERMRRGPYGPRDGSVSRRILELLAERGPLTASEIARELGVRSSYVSSYLAYWRRRGLVEYSSGLWSLTELGRRLLSGPQASSSHYTSSNPEFGRSQFEFDLGELLEELPADERRLLEVLLSHYQRWGSTYTYLDELAEKLGLPERQTLLIARRLQAKQLIYIYRDRQLGVRIGLGRRLRELLEEKGEG